MSLLDEYYPEYFGGGLPESSGVSCPELTSQEEAAWSLYCKDTAGGMDVRDFWWELPEWVQKIYLERVRNAKHYDI